MNYEAVTADARSQTVYQGMEVRCHFWFFSHKRYCNETYRDLNHFCIAFIMLLNEILQGWVLNRQSFRRTLPQGPLL